MLRPRPRGVNVADHILGEPGATLHPPLYIWSQGMLTDLMIFASATDAAVYIEVPDVETGEYGPAYDSLARPVVIELPDPLFEPPRGWWGGRVWRRLWGGEYGSVIVRLANDPEPRVDELRAALATALRLDDGGAGQTLHELGRQAQARFGVAAYQ
jgi:hypothetical protein